MREIERNKQEEFINDDELNQRHGRLINKMGRGDGGNSGHSSMSGGWPNMRLSIFAWRN